MKTGRRIPMVGEERNDDVLGLNESARAVMLIGACVGLVAFVVLFSSGTSFRFANLFAVLVLPVFAYIALIAAIRLRIDAIGLLLSAAMGVFPLVAAPVCLLVLGVMSGGLGSSAWAVWRTILSPMPGAILLSFAGLAALFTSKSKAMALALLVFGFVVGGLFWGFEFTQYEMAGEQNWEQKRQIPKPTGPLNAEEKKLWYAIVACNAAYKVEHGGRAASSLQELGPAGTRCLTADEVSGNSAGMTFNYHSAPGSHDGYSLEAKRADTSDLANDIFDLTFTAPVDFKVLSDNAACVHSAHIRTSALIAGVGENGACVFQIGGEEAHLPLSQPVIVFTCTSTPSARRKTTSTATCARPNMGKQGSTASIAMRMERYT